MILNAACWMITDEWCWWMMNDEWRRMNADKLVFNDKGWVGNKARCLDISKDKIGHLVPWPKVASGLFVFLTIYVSFRDPWNLTLGYAFVNRDSCLALEGKLVRKVDGVHPCYPCQQRIMLCFTSLKEKNVHTAWRHLRTGTRPCHSTQGVLPFPLRPTHKVNKTCHYKIPLFSFNVDHRCWISDRTTMAKAPKKNWMTGTSTRLSLTHAPLPSNFWYTLLSDEWGATMTMNEEDWRTIDAG